MPNRKRSSQKKQQQRRPQQAQPQAQQQGPHLPEQWWQENQDILQYLYEERTIPEIARLVGQSEEQVKAVQAELERLRTVELTSEDTMLILKYLRHPRVERSPELLEQFERFLKKIEEEPEDESKPVIRDGSSNHDKYIYGQRPD
jgi:hypothetical protein